MPEVSRLRRPEKFAVAAYFHDKVTSVVGSPSWYDRRCESAPASTRTSPGDVGARRHQTVRRTFATVTQRSFCSDPAQLGEVAPRRDVSPLLPRKDFFERKHASVVGPVRGTIGALNHVIFLSWVIVCQTA